jgi:hypothetical protein
VHFVVRGETLQVLQRDGLRVDSLVGDFHIPPDRCNATGSTPSLLLPPEMMRCSFLLMQTSICLAKMTWLRWVRWTLSSRQ